MQFYFVVDRLGAFFYPDVNFAEDNVLVFIILREKC